MKTQKYTPPTCTLEVTAKKPRWGQPKDGDDAESFRFKLSFDDPRLSEEEYVTVTGDRDQLENLSHAAVSYVENFLGNSDWFGGFPRSSNNSKPPQPDPDKIYLKPDGLLYHDLFLGALATPNSGPFVHLSTLQLFDLIAALEDCQSDALKVEDQGASPPFSIRFKPLIWFRTALMIAVSIGTLTSIIKLINFYRYPPVNTADISSEEAEPAPIAPPNLNAPALPTWPPPSPSPPPSPPQVAGNLPPVDTAPLPVPPPLFPAPGDPPPPQPLPNVSQQEGLIIIPAEPQPPGPPPQPANPSAPQPVNPPPAVAFNPTPAVPPVPPPLATSTTPPVIPYNPPALQIPPVIQLPPLQNAPSPETLVIVPEENAGENSPDNSALNPEEIGGQTSEENYMGQLDKRPETVAATRQEDTTLFDQIPQVDEVRTYFQQNWYPPKNLRKALQYSLQLNADGTIDSIIPVGQSAVNRLSDVELPAAGEPFVSAMPDGRRPKIRIVLEPSGRVKAFLEAFNTSPPTAPPNSNTTTTRRQPARKPPLPSTD